MADDGDKDELDLVGHFQHRSAESRQKLKDDADRIQREQVELAKKACLLQDIPTTGFSADVGRTYRVQESVAMSDPQLVGSFEEERRHMTDRMASAMGVPREMLMLHDPSSSIALDHLQRQQDRQTQMLAERQRERSGFVGINRPDGPDISRAPTVIPDIPRVLQGAWQGDTATLTEAPHAGDPSIYSVGDEVYVDEEFEGIVTATRMTPQGLDIVSVDTHYDIHHFETSSLVHLTPIRGVRIIDPSALSTRYEEFVTGEEANPVRDELRVWGGRTCRFLGEEARRFHLEMLENATAIWVPKDEVFRVRPGDLLLRQAVHCTFIDEDDQQLRDQIETQRMLGICPELEFDDLRWPTSPLDEFEELDIPTDATLHCFEGAVLRHGQHGERTLTIAMPEDGLSEMREVLPWELDVAGQGTQGYTVNLALPSITLSRTVPEGTLVWAPLSRTLVLFTPPGE
jgi:hypothetical protein